MDDACIFFELGQILRFNCNISFTCRFLPYLGFICIGIARVENPFFFFGCLLDQRQFLIFAKGFLHHAYNLAQRGIRVYTFHDVSIIFSVPRQALRSLSKV
jgi:hypothetical protein